MSPSDTSSPLAHIEITSTSYYVLNLNKTSKFKMYFDQYCYVACSEKLFFSPVIPPSPHPPLFISRPKTPNEVVQAQENWL